MQRARAVQPKGRRGGRNPKAGTVAVAVVHTVPTTVSQALACCRRLRAEAGSGAESYQYLLKLCVAAFNPIHPDKPRELNPKATITCVLESQAHEGDIVTVFQMPDRDGKAGERFCIGRNDQWAGDVADRPSPGVATFGENARRTARRPGALPRGAEKKPPDDDIPF